MDREAKGAEKWRWWRHCRNVLSNVDDQILATNAGLKNERVYYVTVACLERSIALWHEEVE